MMTWETIQRADHDEGIVRLSLDRPETHNAQNPEMLDELDDAIQEIAAEDDARVLILDGNGPSFSAGHDLGREGFDKAWTAEERLAFEQEYYFDKSMRIRDVKIPTIAQIHGYCGAAGMMLFSVCDLAIATEAAEIQNPVTRMSAAGLELLLEPWEVGIRKAKEVLWTGDSISGREAERLGMVNRTVPEADIDTETMILATKIARMPPFAIKLSKKSFNFMQDQMGQRDAYRYHFMVHQLSHASEEWGTSQADAKEVIREEGMQEWVRQRDEPFDVDPDSIDEP